MAIPLPPISLSAPSSATSSNRLEQAGNVWEMGNGPWNVDFGNSGASGAAAAGVSPLVVYAIGAGVLWLIFRSRI